MYESIQHAYKHTTNSIRVINLFMAAHEVSTSTQTLVQDTLLS